MQVTGDALLALVVGFVGILITLVQLVIEFRARRRNRDAELTDWGMRVISMMAELEEACLPLVSSSVDSPSQFASMAHKASALVDQGRLFFPNVPFSNVDRGYRVKLLDEVVRACYVAQHMAQHLEADGAALRAQVWSARTRFVMLLQEIVRPTLRTVKLRDAGERIPNDPGQWSAPEFIPGVVVARVVPHIDPLDLARRP